MKKRRTTMGIINDFPSLLFFIAVLSFPTRSSSQSNPPPPPPPPRNIETFYPFAYSPPPQPDGSAPSPSPPPRSPSSWATSKKAIMTAVGATAASTLVLAAVFFLIFLLCSRSRRRKERISRGRSSRRPPLPPAVPASGSRSEYRKLGGNVKGYIIDEDGLDMLYWKKFSNSGGGFKKEPYTAPLAANGKRLPVAPLPRGRSSSSHAQIHAPQQPPISTMAVPKAPPPPPPPPSPPPPPPPVPVKKVAPAPPPPPSSNPPAAPPSKGAEDGADSDQVKLKALHWEKLNINPDHSMVWNKLDKGSFQLSITPVTQ